MSGPTPARTPPSFTFEDSDSEFDAEMTMPDYEPMSPVVVNLEKMVANRKIVPSESGTTTETISSVEPGTSTKRSISSMDSTTPESPIEAFLSRPETPNYPYSNWSSASAFTMRNGQVYNFGQLQMMSLEVAEARRNGEFPATNEPTLDANAVAEDFNSLIYLRRLRGNQLTPAPQSYIHFREQVALGIQARQVSLKRETDQEVARRVDHYLQAVEAEQRYYNATNTMFQRREVINPTQQDFIDPHDDMCSMVEHTIEQGISDATGPLRMNVSNLKKQGEVFQEQTALLQQQNDIVMNASLTHLSNLVEPQIYNNQATAQTLASANQLVVNLSQQLPETIRCAVEEASQKQAREILEQALQIQQMAIANPQRDAKTITAPVEEAQEKNAVAVGSDRDERSERSSLYRMVRKFKRQRISS
ncbi:hypothetical protein FOC1_g10014206 [Fusarium oxysporum f. sp. cubense race 1]|uniref:Uncharacterized protein n=1 Tax=Fusarium oxysporum f. sp. cubense (strain race 1) TaxID=1229664 RepID=N4TXT3_FUSC1|nr:hypothetical protein FOC1_g10014206 [Fusarium oxysporum f. sp. cubense race 1]